MSDLDQAKKAARFTEMHRQDGIIVLPNCWDAASACVLADAGFPAIATTSGGCAFSLGYCDGENIPRDEMLGAVGRITRSVSIPVSADMEAGYGKSPEAVAETARVGCSMPVLPWSGSGPPSRPHGTVEWISSSMPGRTGT